MNNVMTKKTAKDSINSYMTIIEAAKYLGVSPMTLRRWDNAGKLQAKRHPMNRYRLYRKDELDEVLKSIK